MIDAERLQDAIGLLPEELLSPVDALRRQKRSVWKPFAAVAASLLLAVGLWQLQPMANSAEKGSYMEDAAEGSLMDGYVGNSIEHSTSLYAYFFAAKITEIAEDYFVVTLAEGQTAKVFFDNVENPEKFSLGEEIILCFDQQPEDLKKLHPKEIIRN